MNQPKKIEDMTDEEAFAAALAHDDSLPQLTPAADPAPAGDDATAQAAGETVPADEGEQAAAGGEGVDNGENGTQPSEEESWLAALPDDVRNRFTEQLEANRTLAAELAKTRNDHASLAGKLKPLQQKLSTLENQLKRNTPAPASSASASNPADPGVVLSADQLAAQLETPEFLEWKRTFPEEAKMWESQQRAILKAADRLVEERVTKAISRLEGRYNPVIERVETDQRTSELNERKAQLAQVHPDWQQHSESEQFSNWFNETYLPSLPTDVQQRFNDPNVVARALSEPQYAARVLTEFKRDLGIVTSPGSDAGAGGPSATPTPKQPAANPSVRLRLAADPNVGAAAPRAAKRLDMMTPEEQFLAGLNSPD